MSDVKEQGILNQRNYVIQLVPQYYPVWWEKYLAGQANNWTPNDVDMRKDKTDYETLTEDEKLALKRTLGFFSAGESLVSNNIIFTIYKYITAPEARMYLLRQAYEESLHLHTFVTVIDTLSLDPAEIYEAYEKVPTIKKKDDFLISITTDMDRPDFDISDIECRREFIKNLLTFYIVCEGILFYSGFALLLSFGRQNKMTGLSKQIEYTYRDESLHIEFGTSVINRIRQEYPDIWTTELENELIEHIKTAVELEIEYANDLLPRGILGLNKNMFEDYVKYIANRRLEDLNIKYSFDTKGNPFPWMSELIDLKKDSNFFESTPTEYQMGTLDMDF